MTSPLRYVCLSDLHLGSRDSVLTSMDERGKTDLREPSPVLSALGAGLREYVPLLSGAEPPTLVLLGDVLDLGQSPFGAVAQAFKRFIEVVFPADGTSVFSTELLCVPGNHDHHLWRMAQDRHFLGSLPGTPRDANGAEPWIPDLIEHTQLFERGALPCDMMTELMHGYPHLKDASVRVSYPNLGLLDEERFRCVVLHHGHYVDSTYRLMSSLHERFAGTAAPPRTAAQIERENGAWVDFLFSELGSSGAVGRDAVTLYETLRDAAASRRFGQQLSDVLLDQLSRSLGVGRNTAIVRGVTVANVVRSLVDMTLGRGAESERDSYLRALSPAGVAELRWYLAGPVRRQIAEAGKIRASREVSFVFGHTHKPFQDQVVVEGFTRPVAVYNTGGWVMDQPTMAATQGGAAVLIDDEMNLASLRLFNDPINGESLPVRAVGIGGFRDQDNPFLVRMTEALRPAAAVWEAFSAQARAAVELHARVMLDTFAGPGRSR